LPLITVISGFGDSTFSMFRSNHKTFNERSIAARKLFEGHDYTVCTAEKAFLAEVLSIHRLQNVIVPKVANLPEKTKYRGKIVVIVDDHVIRLTSRVTAFAGSQKLPLIRRV
jgi:hypothetical protein